MAINIYSDYGGFYNSYKPIDIPKVDVEEVKKQDELKKAEELANPYLEAKPVETVETKPDTRSRMADLDNISLTFNSGDDYSYIGSDFNIEDLDIAKAISDMKKDGILQDYQYFVGNQNDLSNLSSDDGKVFLKL